MPSDKPYKFYRVLVSSGTQQTPISKEARKALFDVAGTPDIDTDKDGVLIEPNDPKEKDEAYNEVKFIILIKAVRPFYNDYAAVSPEVRADADFILTALGVDQLKPGTQVNIGDGINRDELTVLADNGVLTREYGAARPKPFQSFEVATRFLRWVNTSVDSVRIKEAYLNYYGLDLRDPAKDPAEAADFSRPWKASNISKDAWKILVDKIFYDKFGIPRFG
ncbi:MAG: hypothetical protein HYT89_02545 [Candidatus Omnitrophica bacterium]|nr:hypothetical protein [Candidatus Omnitrophota bacterium]